MEAMKKKDAERAKTRKKERGRLKVLRDYHSYQKTHVTDVLEERQRVRDS
jgi:hypothetical protein